MKKQVAQSLSEYVLAGALVACACIVALSTIGGNVNSVLAMLHTDMTGKPKTPAGTPKKSSLPPVSTTTGGTTIILSNGQEITIPLIPTNLAVQIETAGSNGTTQILAGSLLQLAGELRDQAELSDEEYNQLKQLANHGHMLANIMEAVESAARNADSFNALQGSSVSYLDADGNMVHLSSVEHAANSLYAYEGGTNAASQLYHLLEDARKSGGLNHPEVDALVQTLTDMIAYTAKDFNERYEINKYNKQAPHSFVREVAGTDNVTHGNAGGICTAGGGKGNGKSCKDP